MPATLPTLVVNDTRVDRHHGCSAVMATIESQMAKQGMAAVAFWPAHADWRGNETFEHSLESARLVLINGEGTIHHNRLAGRRLLEIGAAARARGIPAALINAGWEANDPELTAMLGNFALVSARDRCSADAMRSGAPGVRVVPDLSLCTAPPRRANRRQGIGVTDNVDRLNALQLERLRRACEGQTVAITHGGPGGYPGFLRAGLSLRADMVNPVRMFGLLGMRHRLWRAATTEVPDFLNQLAGLALLVSGRFHACTLALVGGTPFIAQRSNTNKIAALIADAGLDLWRGELQPDPLVLREAAAQGWSPAEEVARRAYLDRAQLDTDVLFADLRALAT